MTKRTTPHLMHPIRGVLPSIEWRPLADLEVDLSYQRSVEGETAVRMIAAIATRWDWRLCAPLTVSRRGDPARFFVIDGQHRLEAARMRGDIQFLPCIISSFETAAEEAGCFVAINSERRRLGAIETFRAAVASGDAKSVELLQLIEGAGLALAPHDNFRHWKPGELAAIGGLQRAHANRGSAVVSAALTHLAEAFPDEVLRYGGTILAGLYIVHSEPSEDFDADRLFAALLSKSQEDWYRAAVMAHVAFDVPMGEAMKIALMQAYAAASPIAEAA